MKRLIPVLLLLFLSSPVYADDFQDGMDAYDRKDYKTAYEKWKPLAEQGYDFAQTNLGLAYRRGRGVEWDYAEAVKWFRKATEQGDARGQFNLGLMYHYGYGVARDYDEALKWILKATEQGYQDSLKWIENQIEQNNAAIQLMFGVMYEKGQGVVVNNTKAVYWYRMAAKKGDAKAQYKLGEMDRKGQGIEKNIAKQSQR